MQRCPLACAAVLALGCAAAPPPPVARPAHGAPAPAPEATREPEPEPAPETAPALRTCFVVPAGHVLGCEGVSPPLRSPEERAALESAHAAREPGDAASGSRARRGRGPRAQDDDLAPRAFDVEEAALVDALRSERCARAADEPDRALVTYRLARLHYEAHQWPEAYFLFDEVALDPHGAEVATYAASLALDSLNLQLRAATGDAHDDCLARFGPTVARYAAHFCAPSVTDEGLCDVLGRLAEQLETQRPTGG